MCTTGAHIGSGGATGTVVIGCEDAGGGAVFLTNTMLGDDAEAECVGGG